MTEVRVDPAVLEVCAGRGNELSHALRATIALVEPETADAAQGLAGWSTGRALEEALCRWRERVERSGRQAGDIGGGLAACARDYRRADHDVTHHLTHYAAHHGTRHATPSHRSR